MNETRQNLIVGVFAVTGLSVLGLLVLMFGDVLSFVTADTYPVKIHFSEGVTGMREKTSVTLSGKRIGQTVSIDFRDPADPSLGIDVVVDVEERFTLPEGARAAVATSITGFGRPELQVIVEPGLSKRPPLPRDGSAVIPGRLLSPIDQVLRPEMQEYVEKATKHLGELAAGLAPVADDLHNLLKVRTIAEVDTDLSRENVANLYTAVQRLDQTLKSFNEVLADPVNQTNFASILSNAREASEKLNASMDDLKGTLADARGFAADARTAALNLDTTLTTARGAIETIEERMVTVSDSADSTLKNLDRAAIAMTQGNGTIALMLNDNRLYEALVLTARRLTEASTELRDLVEGIKKGRIKVSVF